MNEVTLKQSDILQLNKSSLQELGKAEAIRLLDEGMHDSIELMIFSRKYTEFLTAFNSALKDNAGDVLTQNGRKMEVMGSKITMTNGATYHAWEEDATYADLKRQLDQRKELLKAALKQDTDIIDGDSAVVPKVGVARRNPDSIKITL